MQAVGWTLAPCRPLDGPWRHAFPRSTATTGQAVTMRWMHVARTYAAQVGYRTLPKVRSFFFSRLLILIRLRPDLRRISSRLLVHGQRTRITLSPLFPKTQRPRSAVQRSQSPVQFRAALSNAN
eukprot:8697695-Pyramimonas_sp.AAC.1